MPSEPQPLPEVPEDVEIETVWVVEVPYTPQAQERRPKLRRAHLTRIARLIREDG